ncbi:MAG: hypothetical protein KJ571_02680 [Bacteroidetes bacterium]|nr:hypothetical protein [Bacteroidota bacterium]
MKGKKKKYLFLYLKTGGGHLAPARSVANYLNKYKSDEVEAVLADGFEKTKPFAKYLIEDGYRILQNKSKWIYEWIYAFHKIKFVSEISSFLVSINIEKYLKELFAYENPDKIVVFHFFLIKPVFRTLKKLNLDIPVIIIVTDPYIAHPLWFLNKKRNFVVFSDELKKRCLKIGIEEKRLHVFPFILDEKFSKTPSANEIANYKKTHNFKGDKILLVMGGGDGIPNGEAILQNLMNLNIDIEIGFVCGKNKNLYNFAMQLKEKERYEKLKVYGYIDFVYELLCISDVVITKCGASTFMEILMMKKVPLVNTYIWEQEKGNVDFLVKNKLGIYEKRIHKLPVIVEDLFKDSNKLDSYKNNIEKFHFKNGTANVADFILE